MALQWFCMYLRANFDNFNSHGKEIQAQSNQSFSFQILDVQIEHYNKSAKWIFMRARQRFVDYQFTYKFHHLRFIMPNRH